jgi:hypothetical protein
MEGNGTKWLYFPKIEKSIGTVGISGKARLVVTAYGAEVMRSDFDGHHEVQAPLRMTLEMVFTGWDGDEYREMIAEDDAPKDYYSFGEYIGEHIEEWLTGEETEEMRNASKTA